MIKVLRILIIEDSENDALLIVRMFQQAGYKVHFECVQTEETMDAALVEREWDAIISDYAMPEFSGLAALRVLQRAELDIPFIIVSGKLGADVAVVAMKTGASDYLRKNDLTRLVVAVEQAIQAVENRRGLKKATDALRESEERHKAISEHSHDAICIVNEDAEITWANDKMVTLGGCSKEVLCGEVSFLTFIAPGSKEFVRSNFQKFLDGQPYEHRYSFNFIRSDGETRLCEKHMMDFRDQYGKRNMVISMMDVTDRSRAEAAMAFKNVILTSQVEASIDGILIVDENGKIVLFNQRFSEMWQIPQDVLEQGHDDPLLATVKARLADPESFMKRVRYLYEHRHEKSHDEVRLSDGRTFERYTSGMFGDDGKYYGRAWYFYDITERLQMEERLRYAASEWRRTFDSISDFVFLIDKDFRIVRMNRSCSDAIGENPQDILGKPCYEVMHKSSSDRHGCVFPELLTDGKPHTKEDVGPNGMPLLITVSPVFDDDGKQVGAVHVAKDITGIKRTATELQTAYEELLLVQSRLIQSEKMASLGVLAAGVAHEINNPTAFILSNLGVLKKYSEALAEFSEGCTQLCAAPEAKAAFDALRTRFSISSIEKELPSLAKETIEGAERIKNIVRDLSSFAHPGDGDVKKGNIHECLDGALNIVANELKYKAEVIKEYGDLPQISFNSQQMGQVFVNLFINAVHAIEKQGRITIRTREEGKAFHIVVSDTGKGMPQEMLTKIFDPFFTTKPVGQGTGLGMAIVERIVKGHQGEVDVISTQGEGTTFTIKLPIDAPA